MLATELRLSTIEARHGLTVPLEVPMRRTCPTCNGRGALKTAETVTYEIFREITRAVRQFNAEKLLVKLMTEKGLNVPPPPKNSRCLTIGINGCS